MEVLLVLERMLALAVVAVSLPAVGGEPSVDGAVAVEAAAAVPDSIRAHMEAGRFWKASLALRVHLDPLREASLEDRLVLARAEAGWKNWPGVIEALEADTSATRSAPAEYWYLLGTALQHLGQPERGVETLSHFLTRAEPEAAMALVARSRLLQVAGRDTADASTIQPLLESLSLLRSLSPSLADWTAVELADGLRRQGRPAETERVLDLVVSADAGREGWSWVADAWAVAGDTARALEALERIDLLSPAAPDSGSWLARLWPMRLAVGDEEGATEAATRLLARWTRGESAAGAALLIAEAPGAGPDDLVRAAEALSANDYQTEALEAWRRAVEGGAELGEEERLSRARSLHALGRMGEASREFEALGRSDDPTIGAPALRTLTRIRRREGDRSRARALEDELVMRFPERDEALTLVYLRGDDHQDAGRLDLAIEMYRQVIGMSSSANLAGLARMRWGHIHLTRGEHGAAADVFEAYLAEFPEGRRWDEASYWGAWAATRMGDSVRARALTERLLSEGPLSYYGVLAAQLGSAPFTLDLDEGGPLPEPPWLPAELDVLELLDEAGLQRGAAVQVRALKDHAWESDDILLKLAQELNLRGRTMDGINLGWEVRRRGRQWDKTLLRVVYPFPYRDMVMSFARERDLDPFLLAGLIRQESAFVPDIVSRAGAVGLMQVVPATGRELARAVGPRAFHPDALTTPEVNVHLGTRFLVDLMRRYPAMPLVLSAYNAGPTRADRWKRFPEAADPARFTERIPFAETRGYVKNVTRNRALYQYLYGDADQLIGDR